MDNDLNIAFKMDDWINLITGMGNVLRDRRLSTAVNSPTELAQQDFEDLFAGNSLARKICISPAMNTFREWFTITGEEDLDEGLQNKIDELSIKQKLIEAFTWARLHGGCVIVLGVDDGLDPIEPLRMDTIKSFTWLNILTRWEIMPVRYYSDPFKPKFGEAEIYEITGVNVPGDGGIESHGKLIHESRLLRLDGAMTTRRRSIANNGWCDSVFTAMYEDLRAWGHVLSACETLVTDFSQAVYKYKGLAQAIAANGAELIQARAAVIDMARSVLGAMVIDADGEDFQRQTTNITGLPELWDRFQAQVSSAVDIPITVLFGRSPAGMNATGDSDMRNWYDRLAAERSLYIAPSIEKLIKILFLSKDGSTNGKEPENWRIKWNPLWQETMTEILGNRKTQAEIDAIYIGVGVIDADEVTESRFGASEYSFDTNVDTTIRREMKQEATE